MFSVWSNRRVDPIYDVYAGDDVPPLVRTANLDGAAIITVEVVEVVRLEQLVCKLGEGYALL